LLAAPTGNLLLQQRQQRQQQQLQQLQQQQQQQQPPLSPSSALTFVNAVFDNAPQYTAPYAFQRSSVLPVLAGSGAGPPSAASAVHTVRARPLPASLRAARVAAAAFR
jgi:transcription initiation factor TFIID subunit TAF12